MKTKILIVVVLGCLATIVTIVRFQDSIGIDFYQYWGIAKAQKWSLSPLGSPYIEQYYAKVLNAHIAGSSDLRLIKANERRRELQPFQTPLCYSIFTLLPANYSIAFGIFQILQIILFLSAIVMLSAVYYGNWLRLLSAALLLLILYEPFMDDSRVGNLNCFQLFGFVSILVLADSVLEKTYYHSAIGASTLLMGMMVFLTLFKPNIGIVILLLATYLWVRQGMTFFARALPGAVAFGAVIWTLPCLQFDSWTVWQDWYRYFRTWDSAGFLALIPYGNFSTALLVSKVLVVSVSGSVFLLAALLVASMLIAFIMAGAKEKSLVKGMIRSIIRLLRDPHLTVAAGITATLILSPLVWFHYYTISLLPAFWLLSPRHSWRQAARAGFISIILTSNILPGVLEIVSGVTSINVSYGTVVLGLGPLWAGVLAAIASQEGRGQPA